MSDPLGPGWTVVRAGVLPRDVATALGRARDQGEPGDQATTVTSASRRTASSTSSPQAGCSVWRVLPWTDGESGSPYQALSAMAATPASSTGNRKPAGGSTTRRRWTQLSRRRARVLVRGARGDWLEPYVRVHRAARLHGGPWTSWPAAAPRPDPQAVRGARPLAAGGAAAREQWVFAVQWARLRTHACVPRRAGLRGPADLRVVRQRRRVGLPQAVRAG